MVSSRKGHTEIIAPYPRLPPAKFSVLDESTAFKLRELPASHLARGVVYANPALLDDAGQELRALQVQNPNSKLIQELLKQLRATVNVCGSAPPLPGKYTTTKVPRCGSSADFDPWAIQTKKTWLSALALSKSSRLGILSFQLVGDCVLLSTGQPEQNFREVLISAPAGSIPHLLRAQTHFLAERLTAAVR